VLTKRIIPCLDIQNGQVAKGTCFENVQIIGDPLELALYYNQTGADELVFYDIHASGDGRTPFLKLIESIAKSLTIPFMVGGGIRTVDHIYDCLRAGADKVSINSAALTNPKLLTDGANRYGVQCIVASMDVKAVGDVYHVFKNGGRVDTGLDAFQWAKTCESLGAGELVINAIHCDGMKAGFDIKLTEKIAKSVNIPVIASGGAGKMEDFNTLFQAEAASGGLAASIFHTKTLSIRDLKNYLHEQGIPIRRTI
jgi:cyclase